MIALVDAAVWRSWIFRTCGAVTIFALAIGLGITEFNIAGLSSQAETRENSSTMRRTSRRRTLRP